MLGFDSLSASLKGEQHERKGFLIQSNAGDFSVPADGGAAMGEMTYSEWLHIVDCRLWFRGRWTHSDFEFDWEGAYKYGVNTSEAVDSAIEEAAEQLVDEP